MKLYSKHSKHLVAVDCIIFGYDILQKEIRLLLIKRSFKPSKGKWSLEGGFVEKHEGLDEAASRILRNLTGLDTVYMNQSFSYGETDRDPGARVISVAYCALIPIRDIDKNLAEENGAHWRSLTNLPDLIFDHQDMVKRSLADLQNQIKLQPVGFELLPEKFTLVQLRDSFARRRRWDDRRETFRWKQARDRKTDNPQRQIECD
jgi:ADP-ribose pyrophosphatase YjhB (NUDIX family)